jgi:hypothetical protein
MEIKKGHYPKFYFMRGKTSDLKFIIQRMGAIPESKRPEVAKHYEDHYTPQNRKDLNEWLHQEAMKYRNHQQEVEPEIKRDASKINEVRKSFDLPTKSPTKEEVRRKSFFRWVVG